MLDPLCDSEYELVRARAAANALECGADRRLPPAVAARIWTLRHGGAELPPASRSELQRDLSDALATSRTAWSQMKEDTRAARGLWRQAHGGSQAAWLHWSGRALAAEAQAVAALRRWRDARRMAAYLRGRLERT